MSCLYERVNEACCITWFEGLKCQWNSLQPKADLYTQIWTILLPCHFHYFHYYVISEWVLYHWESPTSCKYKRLYFFKVPWRCITSHPRSFISSSESNWQSLRISVWLTLHGQRKRKRKRKRDDKGRNEEGELNWCSRKKNRWQGAVISF